MPETHLNPGSIMDTLPEAQTVETQARAGVIADMIRPAFARASADPSAIGLSDKRSEMEANVQAVAMAAALDPATTNNLGAEKWWQSGVLWGTVQALILAVWAWIKVVIPMFSTEVDMELALTMTGAVGTAAWAVYRRAAPNLTPLFWKQTWRAALVVAGLIALIAVAIVLFL